MDSSFQNPTVSNDIHIRIAQIFQTGSVVFLNPVGDWSSEVLQLTAHADYSTVSCEGGARLAVKRAEAIAAAISNEEAQRGPIRILPAPVAVNSVAHLDAAPATVPGSKCFVVAHRAEHPPIQFTG